MLTDLKWIDNDAKAEALTKLHGYVKNIGY